VTIDYGQGTYGGGVAPPPAPSIDLAPPPPTTEPGGPVPHFSLPFRFAGPRAAVSEQDSLDEIADCCVAILTCPQGFRIELPRFGLPDPTFTMPGPSLDVVRTAIETWEPRASTVLDEYPDLLDVLVSHIEGYVQARTEA
jgi:hypothetical protein